MTKNKYIITTAGKFHHFDFAREMVKKNQLTKIISGYPWFKLKKARVTSGIFQMLSKLYVYYILQSFSRSEFR